MSFGSVVRGAITRGFTGYFDFKGVASRSDYWTWVAFVFAFNLVLPRFSFLLVIPSIAYGVRRMHDVGKSGWWLVLWPIAFFYSLKPTRASAITTSSSSSVADVWMSARVEDAQSLAKTIVAKFEVVRDALKKSSATSTDAAPSGSDATHRPSAPPTTAKAPTPPDTKKPSTRSATTTAEKPAEPADIEAFMKIASGLGIVTSSDESPVAVVQSLIRRIWSQIRSQQESDPLHTDHLRLAIRALADYANGSHSVVAKDPIERAKAIMWYGILLAIVSTDDRGPTTLGSLARQSSSDALRQARTLFETKNDTKMAGRCMEELGQLGRLLGRSDLMTEGFDEAVKLFNLAGATDRAKQAITNAGSNYQRHSSAFFDGGQHSLKATTILGSVQGERLRAQLHHLD
jgi:uncharacterized membrane protein YhaH (DUF805 family)